MAGLLLTDLIDVTLLQKIQDEFSRYTGMSALTTDAEGNPITEGSGFAEFCMDYTRKSELGYKRCVVSDRNAALAALESGKPVVYVCHAGLADFASPIMLGDKLIGCFLGGQVRLSSKIDKDALKATADELGIEYESYYKAMKKTSTASRKELEKAANFVGIVANVLSDMAYQNYMAIDKYRNLERAARSQSHFLMDLSSDLHANMSDWISSLEESVKNGNVESVMDVINTMLTNGTTTYSIIGDIVDYMKFSDGNVALYESCYSIYDVLEAVIELEQEEATQKQVHLSYEIAENVPHLLLGDGGRIGQMMAKIISYEVSAKDIFGEETNIHVAVSTKKESYAHILEIAVCDSGKPMDEKEVEELQEYFSRGILDTKKSDEANEFGLSIVDLFVRQMQGRIMVNSDNEGVRFVIRLPQLEVTEG